MISFINYFLATKTPANHNEAVTVNLLPKIVFLLKLK